MKWLTSVVRIDAAESSTIRSLHVVDDNVPGSAIVGAATTASAELPIMVRNESVDVQL